jgi:hypothetical protein
MLSGERWRAASSYLDEALDLPSEERAAWLASLRATNPSLAADVSALLDEHDALVDRRFLEERVAPVDGPQPDRPGASFGRYRLVQQLGEGGMGMSGSLNRSSRSAAPLPSRSLNPAPTPNRCWRASSRSARHSPF